MNEHFRISIAVLISLVLHIVVLMWIMHLVQVRVHDGQGLLQVFLKNDAREQERPLQLPVGTAATTLKNPQSKPARKPADVPLLPRSVAGGHFRAPASSPIQQDELQNSMHLAQLAQQREAQRAAVMAGMSGLAAQLRPAVKSRIACVQQKDDAIDCTPDPDESLRPLLEQFFNLAIEARRLGAAGNPVRMDFGPEASVSIALQH